MTEGKIKGEGVVSSVCQDLLGDVIGPRDIRI